MNARRLVLFFALVSLATPVFAQSSGRFSLTRNVVAGGGTTFSASSRFQLGSTIAQPVAAVPSSARFSIQDGFWIVPSFLVVAPTKTGTDFKLSFDTEPGQTYTVEYTDSLLTPNWQSLPSKTGNGTLLTVTNSAPGVSSRYYRVRQLW